MFDLIVSGGTAVMPTGAEAGRYRGLRRQDRRDRRAGQPCARSAPRGSSTRPGRSSSPAASIRISIASSPIPFPGRNEDMLSAPPDQVSRAALYGGTTTMLDFADVPAGRRRCSNRSSRASANGPAPAIATTAFT